jgi:hypothetical protein
MGQAPEGLRTPDEARTVVQDTKERVCEAELHRFRAELQLIQAGETPHARTMAVEAEAETYFHQALAIARRQGAKSLEL